MLAFVNVLQTKYWQCWIQQTKYVPKTFLLFYPENKSIQCHTLLNYLYNSIHIHWDGLMSTQWGGRGLRSFQPILCCLFKLHQKLHRHTYCHMQLYNYSRIYNTGQSWGSHLYPHSVNSHL